MCPSPDNFRAQRNGDPLSDDVLTNGCRANHPQACWCETATLSVCSQALGVRSSGGAQSLSTMSGASAGVTELSAWPELEDPLPRCW